MTHTVFRNAIVYVSLTFIDCCLFD